MGLRTCVDTRRSRPCEHTRAHTHAHRNARPGVDAHTHTRAGRKACRHRHWQRSVLPSQPLCVRHVAHVASHIPGWCDSPLSSRWTRRFRPRNVMGLLQAPSQRKSGRPGSSRSDPHQRPARGCQACGGSNRWADGWTDGESGLGSGVWLLDEETSGERSREPAEKGAASGISVDPRGLVWVFSPPQTPGLPCAPRGLRQTLA